MVLIISIRNQQPRSFFYNLVLQFLGGFGYMFVWIIACKLGNRYGVSNDAQQYSNKMLNKLSTVKWEWYFNTVFQGDEIVLYILNEKSS